MNQEHDTTPQGNTATIERCPHDKQNPYVMVSREFMRDLTISANCHRLLCILLSNADGWVIRIGQLIKQMAPLMGRDAVRSAIKEAIAAGYMRTEPYREGNLTRFRYFVSEFKKCYRHTGFQEVGDQEVGDPPPKKEQGKERSLKDPLPPPKGGAYPSNRKGLRANGENPRARAMKDTTVWIKSLVDRFGEAASQKGIEIHVTAEKLYVNQGCSPLSNNWTMKNLGREDVRSDVLLTLARMGLRFEESPFIVAAQTATRQAL